MPNAHAADKVVLSVRIPITLRARLEKRAKKKGWNLSRLVISILNDAVYDIELTPQDYQEIAQAVATKTISAVSARSKRSGRKAGEKGED
jgi:hypothetical protein